MSISKANFDKATDNISLTQRLLHLDTDDTNYKALNAHMENAFSK